MMRVKVENKCPYCAHVETFTDPIEFTPFAAMASKPMFVGFNEGKAYDLASSGETKCMNCDEKFLYKFDAKPVCLTAKRPEYREAG